MNELSCPVSGCSAEFILKFQRVISLLKAQAQDLKTNKAATKKADALVRKAPASMSTKSPVKGATDKSAVKPPAAEKAPSSYADSLVSNLCETTAQIFGFIMYQVLGVFGLVILSVDSRDEFCCLAVHTALVEERHDKKVLMNEVLKVIKVMVCP
jgi:hypothetical protein